MSYAEEAAEEFKKDIETACDSIDLPYILCLLHVDERAEWIANNLEEAYEAMEVICQEVRYNTNFSEIMIRNIISYISYKERCIYNDIDAKVHGMKRQIAERGLLKAPKFGTWQSMDITNEVWDQIIAAAKEVQHTDDHEYLEQGEHNENGESFEDTEVGVDDELVELSNSDKENEMDSQLSLKKGPSETFQMEKLKKGQPCDYCGFISDN